MTLRPGLELRDRREASRPSCPHVRVRRRLVESVLIPFARPDVGSLPLPRLRAATQERSGQVVRTFHVRR